MKQTLAGLIDFVATGGIVLLVMAVIFAIERSPDRE